MSHYCSVCGRELTKTDGPIGPKCLQKMRPRNMRNRGITKSQYIRMWAKYDMYGGINGQKKDDAASEDTEGQEVCQNGEDSQAASSQGRRRRSQV
ncbi:MAG: hypothetical protein ACXAC5_01265 [Promethearchaeota archaeon]